MFTKVPLSYYGGMCFLTSLATFATVVYKPPLRFSMPFFAIQILFGIAFLFRSVAEFRIQKAKNAEK